MKDPDATNQSIEQYLLGHLNAAERAAFEEKLQTDSDLAQATARQQKIINGVEAQARQKLRARLQEFHEEMETAPPARPQARYLWLALVALAILLAAAYYWWTRPVGPEILYAQYYQTYPLELAQRDQGNSSLYQLEQAYQNKDFQTAAPLLDSLLLLRPKDAQLALAAGMLRLESGQTQQALPYFQSIMDGDDFLYRDQAIWYMALARLQQGQVEGCKSLLQELASDAEADHHQEALDLLKQL